MQITSMQNLTNWNVGLTKAYLEKVEMLKQKSLKEQSKSFSEAWNKNFKENHQKIAQKSNGLDQALAA